MIDPALSKFPHTLPKGKLADVAPTILAWRKYPIPSSMYGNNLLADIPI
jgi:bisphosphoglycerate-independent phosphoglycerate mutase (AlkP superfamily)